MESKRKDLEDEVEELLDRIFEKMDKKSKFLKENGETLSNNV